MDKFDYKDWDIEVELETGHDDFIYGNYVDWNTFREQEEDNLLTYFDIFLPWGKELTISEYLNFVSQEVFIVAPHIIEAFNVLELPISKTDTNLSKIRIRFPDKKNIDYDFIISEIFDVYGVPAGIDFEHDLPENLQYWSSITHDDLNEYDYYKRFPFEFSTYITKLSDIRSKIDNTSDPLTQKSLILYSLIISESLFKAAILSKIPEESEISSFGQDIIKKQINRDLRSNHSRNKLFKSLFGKKAPNPSWLQLRNSLAHDIENPDYFDEKIIYSKSDNTQETYPIDDLFDDLKMYYYKLHAIMDSDN